MTGLQRVFAAIAVGAFVISCGDKVDYDPSANPDSTAPGTNVLIKSAGEADREVQDRAGPSANVNLSFGDIDPKAKRDFSVLATATDNESGINFIKLSLTRTVCFVASNGGVAQAYSGTVTRKEATYPDQENAPTQASLGDTGIIDNTNFAVANPADDNLLVWVNANQTRSAGVGVSTRWGMETRNFAGLTTYSDVITVFGGDVSCVTTP